MESFNGILEQKNDANGAVGGQSYNVVEQELIRQLIQSRLAQKSQLEYENLDGYELPPRTQFSMLKKPAVTIRYKEMTFNMACIRMFDGVQHILPIANREKRRLAVIPCAEEESASVEWARIRQKDSAWANKTITSLEFVETIYSMMGWDRNCRYKVLGRVAASPKGLIFVFDLSEAIMFAATPTEYIDKATGEVKKRRIIYYPDEYKGRIGKSYNDYAATQQMNLFEFLDGYSGQPEDNAKQMRTDGSDNQTETMHHSAPESANATPMTLFHHEKEQLP